MDQTEGSCGPLQTMSMLETEAPSSGAPRYPQNSGLGPDSGREQVCAHAHCPLPLWPPVPSRAQAWTPKKTPRLLGEVLALLFHPVFPNPDPPNIGGIRAGSEIPKTKGQGAPLSSVPCSKTRRRGVWDLSRLRKKLVQRHTPWE